MRTNADVLVGCRPLNLADVAAGDAPLSQRTTEVSRVGTSGYRHLSSET